MLPLSYAVLYATAGFAPIVQLILVVITGAVSYLGVAWWTEIGDITTIISRIPVLDDQSGSFELFELRTSGLRVVREQ